MSRAAAFAGGDSGRECGMRRGKRRRWAWAAAAVLTLAALAATYAYLTRPAVLRERLLDALADAGLDSTEVGEVWLASPGRIHVERLSARRLGREFVHVAIADVLFHTWSLLTGRVRVTEIILREPRLTLAPVM